MSKLFKGVDISWKPFIESEFQKSYMQEIKSFLINCSQNNEVIYPHPKDIFKSLELTSFQSVKVVILGQDPYHGPNQAHGLAFSVKKNVPIPPSLKNIFKELSSDLDVPLAKTGNLSVWAKQGVLLLNATLSVRVKQAGSHQNMGWELFTNRVIQEISEKKDRIVFLLWGRFAQDKSHLIDENKHHILKAPHPSPFSAYSGFFGCKHFSKTNAIFKKQGLKEIDWKI